MCALIILWTKLCELRPYQELYAYVRSSVFSAANFASCHLPTHQTKTGPLLQKDSNFDTLKLRNAIAP